MNKKVGFLLRLLLINSVHCLGERCLREGVKAGGIDSGHRNSSDTNVSYTLHSYPNQDPILEWIKAHLLARLVSWPKKVIPLYSVNTFLVMWPTTNIPMILANYVDSFIINYGWCSLIAKCVKFQRKNSLCYK